MKVPFSDEYVDKVTASVEGRSFRLYGSDGSEQEMICDTVDQFTAVFEMIKDNMHKLPNGFHFE